jgi:hypothetical protein
MVRRLVPTPQVVLVVSTVCLGGAAFWAEWQRRERFFASYREQAAQHERLAAWHRARAEDRDGAEAAMRRVVERFRRGAETCLRRAEDEPPGFARDLWIERRDEFLDAVARSGREADAIAAEARAERERAEGEEASARHFAALARGLGSGD